MPDLVKYPSGSWRERKDRVRSLWGDAPGDSSPDWLDDVKKAMSQQAQEEATLAARFWAACTSGDWSTVNQLNPEIAKLRMRGR